MSNANQSSITKPAPAIAAGCQASAEPELSDLLNRGYVCAPDASPAWRAAYEAGVDMALLEDALRMSPEARLREHQRALNQILALIQGRPSP